jgi:hypothetical protein
VSPKLSGGYHDEITFKKDGSVIFYGVKDDGTLFDASTSTWKWGDSNETTLIENNGKNTWAYTVIKLTDKELVLKSNIEGTNISWTAK